AAGAAIEAHVCDIREEDQVERMVDAVLDAHGSIDLLVNNAGGQFLAPAESITPKGFRTVIRLNVEGTWLVTHAVATKAMIPSGRGGRIVSVTLSPHNGMPGMAHSGAARAAVENLMRTLAVEWARFRIGLVAVAAGQFATQTLLNKYPQPIVDRIAETIPAGRLGSERELAALVAYLCSPAADFLTGTVVTIDGARDDWLGVWPPAAASDAEGAPLSEERVPRIRDVPPSQ
ncbi:MAG: SDR family oxidoreductase, partial [Solirubrobacteraceae bacterium]